MKKLILVTIFLSTCFLSVGQASALTINFDSNDGGFVVTNFGAVENPWSYASGGWHTDGTESLGSPSASLLTSPEYTVASDGDVILSFDHRYSFEYDGTTRWDGGQVKISINGGAFSAVLNSSFSQNGYIGIIQGNNILNGQNGFNSNSSGYSNPDFISSVANLGIFSSGDIFQIQYAAAWDEFAKGSEPNWQIDSVQLTNLSTPIPEPATMLLLGTGLVGVAGAVRRKKKNQA